MNPVLSLVRTGTLRDIGGIEAIRDALIDDCALARRFKAKGMIWLGLTDRVASIRSYPGWSDMAQMVSRSAYAQLEYSPVQLVGTVLALLLTFVVPPMAALAGSGYAQVFGVTAWATMARTPVSLNGRPSQKPRPEGSTARWNASEYRASRKPSPVPPPRISQWPHHH